VMLCCAKEMGLNTASKVTKVKVRIVMV
jgi:hypothetical protein